MNSKTSYSECRNAGRRSSNVGFKLQVHRKAVRQSACALEVGLNVKKWLCSKLFCLNLNCHYANENF